jgi:regulator of sigma D
LIIVLDQSPRNELKLAITNGDLFLVRESIENLENRLIELNIDVLIHAIENGHLSILEYIIDKGAYDNIIRNNRLYDISDSFGHDHITRFLLEYNGITLNEACRIGDTVAVRFFLDKNPNNMFNDGREKGSNYYYALIASLNTAARYGQLKVVELLVQNGAKSTHEMIQLAKNHNNLLIVDFLEKHLTQTCDENNSIAQEIEWNGKLNSISRRNVPMEELIMNDLSTTDCIVTMYFGPSIALHKIILKDKVNENFSKYLFSVMYPEWIHETFQFLYNKGRFTKKSFTPIFKNLRQILVPDTDFYKDFCKMSIDYFKKKHLKMTRNDFKDLSCFELLLLMQSESDTQPYSFFYVFMQWANLQADTDLKHLSSFGVTLMKSPSCEQGYVVSVLKEFPSGVDKIFNCSDLIGIF